MKHLPRSSPHVVHDETKRFRSIPSPHTTAHDKDKDKDKDLFIGPQEFVVGYSKAPEQPQSGAKPICRSHTMTRTGREPATVRIAA